MWPSNHCKSSEDVSGLRLRGARESYVYKSFAAEIVVAYVRTEKSQPTLDHAHNVGHPYMS
jgi:hypothetical protein